MSIDESGDLTHNPFAEDNGYVSGSNLAQEYSNSLVPKLSNPLSLSTQNIVKGTTGKGGKLTRSVPEISVVPESAGGLHPLKSALARQNDTVLYDLGVTRPHLSRIISERNPIKDSLSEQDDTSTFTTSSSNEEIEVIVHEVSSKDSLAGVSLKYGISLPNLRKANQLWATDSIHLRDVLYIPIEQAYRAREFMPEPQIMTLTSESQEPVTSKHASPIHPSSSEGSVEPTSTSPPIPIRKIPSSQLTFFPPSTSKSFESNLNGPYINVSLHPSESHGPPAGAHSRHISSPASYSLSSILTALPIAASTRDEIITRLSFDSVRSNVSDKSRTNSDDETGHELDDVAKHKDSRIPKTLCEDVVDELSMPTPKAPQNPEILSNQQGSRITSSPSLPKNSYVRSLSSMSPPRFYVSQAYETSVRTYQMEPSPSMQLPTFRNHAVVHSSGRLAQEKAAATESSAVLQRKPRP